MPTSLACDGKCVFNSTQLFYTLRKYKKANNHPSDSFLEQWIQENFWLLPPVTPNSTNTVQPRYGLVQLWVLIQEENLFSLGLVGGAA